MKQEIDFYGFDLLVIFRDPELMMDFNKFYLDVIIYPIKMFFRVLMFDVKVWETKHPILNYALTILYGGIYQLLFWGTLVYLICLI